MDFPRDLRGDRNPNWKGGSLSKECAVCGSSFSAKRAQAKARFCSLKCVGLSQRGRKGPNKAPAIICCLVCGSSRPVQPSRAERIKTCSRRCSSTLRSQIVSGEENGNWAGGLSREPYSWNFYKMSRALIAHYGRCLSPLCRGEDKRLTTHHINYNKADCRDGNLIVLCSSCNTRANFNREKWQAFFERRRLVV